MSEKKRLSEVQPGDTVVRWFYGAPMMLLVTEVTTHRIVCGPREFCRLSGAEIDEGLGLGGGMRRKMRLGMGEMRPGF